MATTHEVRHISVSIDRPPSEVSSFVSDPENLPKWATGLGGSIKKRRGEWIADARRIEDIKQVLPEAMTYYRPQ